MTAKNETPARFSRSQSEFGSPFRMDFVMARKVPSALDVVFSKYSITLQQKPARTHQARQEIRNGQMPGV